MIASIGLAYDPERIEAYFAKRPGELNEHASSVWATLAGLALPALGAALSTWAVLVAANPPPEEREQEEAWASVRRELAPRVVRALSQLGPTYIKFGQSLASRPDIVSAEIASELMQLQDAVPAFNDDVARQILAHELAGRGPAAEELLASLQGAEPVAAASLGQVYKGRVGGRDVAVKVQRPEVRRAVAADAALLKALARRAAAVKIPAPATTPARKLRGDVVLMPLVRADLMGAVDEFCSRLFEELDYSNEAANMERFAGLYGAEGEHAARIPAPGVRVPELLHELCTRRVLVMEWIDGERLVTAESDGSNVVAEGDMALIEIGIEATLLQLLDTGVMHTDPHGGNLWKVPWQPPAPTNGKQQEHRAEAQHAVNQLVYLDFGLIADVPLQVRNGLVCAVMYIIQKRWDRVASLFNQLMLLPDWVLQDEQTLARFTADIEAASRVALDFDSAGPDGVPSLRFSALLEQLAFLAPRYEFRLPPYFLNNARAIGCLEGMARAADPSFNILRRMYPFALRRLLTNPSDSPVVRRTLRDLARDERTGWLSRRAAYELVDAAAALQGSTRKEVVLGLLRTRGGVRFTLEVVWGECMAKTEAVAERFFSFVDRWAIRARKRLFPESEWEPEDWEIDEEQGQASSSSSKDAATEALEKPQSQQKQASSSSKAAATPVLEKPQPQQQQASSSSSKAAAPAPEKPQQKEVSSSSSKAATPALEKPQPQQKQASASSSSSSSSSTSPAPAKTPHEPASEKPASKKASSSPQAAVTTPAEPSKAPSKAAGQKETAATSSDPPTGAAVKQEAPKAAAGRKDAAAALDEPPPPSKKETAKAKAKGTAKAKAKARAQAKGPPPLPPGEHWTKYDDEGVLWYYYEGPAGKWWCEDGSSDIKRYTDG